MTANERFMTAVFGRKWEWIGNETIREVGDYDSMHACIDDVVIVDPVAGYNEAMDALKEANTELAAMRKVVEAAVARRQIEKQLLVPTLVNGLIIAAFQDSSDELRYAVDTYEGTEGEGC